MIRLRWVVIAALMVVMAMPLAAQQTGGMTGRMKGMAHDSATMAQMRMIHELVMNHQRITRSVLNLADGVRTVTESDDPFLARRIREHVVSMQQRLAAGDDPGLPMESPATHTIFLNYTKVRTVLDSTEKGVVVVQTSDDSATVAALQRHAAEVSDLVRQGMAAMHATMMQHGRHDPDTAFAALQARGQRAMGVDQYTSTHRFDTLEDGGRIELQRDADDSAGVAVIRAHLQGIVKAFTSGDFSTPAFVHMREVPGTVIMAANRDVIEYSFGELPRGGAVRILTKDPVALKSIHDFLEFQRHDHRAGGIGGHKMPH
jgi:hypothetical protein